MLSITCSYCNHPMEPKNDYWICPCGNRVSKWETAGGEPDSRWRLESSGELNRMARVRVEGERYLGLDVPDVEE